jgi:hypothetical protein
VVDAEDVVERALRRRAATRWSLERALQQTRGECRSRSESGEREAAEEEEEVHGAVLDVLGNGDEKGRRKERVEKEGACRERRSVEKEGACREGRECVCRREGKSDLEVGKSASATRHFCERRRRSVEKEGTK